MSQKSRRRYTGVIHHPCGRVRVPECQAEAAGLVYICHIEILPRAKYSHVRGKRPRKVFSAQDLKDLIHPGSSNLEQSRLLRMEMCLSSASRKEPVLCYSTLSCCHDAGIDIRRPVSGLALLSDPAFC